MNHDDIDLTGYKVMVVDDTPANMDILRGILKDQGYRIFAAPSGELALEIAPKTLPDIILLDIMMPGIDGLETCRRLKKMPQTSHIPIIFVTAKTEMQDQLDGFAAGGVDYIHKPIHREEVLVRVHTHLEIVALFKAQDASFRAQEKLSKELTLKNKAIIDTQQQLVQSEKMASLGTLTSGVAHEINNPNNFVHVSAQNLQVDLTRLNKFLIALAGDNADEAVLASFRRQFAPLHKHIEMITEGSTRIKNIVQDLRVFTQLDAGKLKDINVCDCIHSTINLVRTNYLNTVEFVIDLPPELVLRCYPAQLNQVFMNLIVNACDAIRQRQLHQASTQSEVERGTVTIACKAFGDSIEITIKDDGYGMTEQTKNKLFEPFYTTKDVGEGSGLGLSISYGIVQKHQGQLTVESQLSEGSVFTLTLPSH